MSLSLIVVLLGALVATAGTAVLVTRCTRTPRAYYVAWALALSGLAAALGCQLIGSLAGYDDMLFRAMELGAQMVAPLALCLSLVEVLGRSVQVRFAMRLVACAIAVIALVVLSTDPLNLTVPFSTTWPDPAVYYQPWPHGVLDVLTTFTVVTAVATVGVMVVRPPGDDDAKGAARPVVASCAAVALLAVPGLATIARSAGGVSLPLSGRSGFALACTGAAVLTWLAGRQAARLDQAGVRVAAGTRGPGPDDDWLDSKAGPRTGSYRDDGDHDWGEPGGSFDDSEIRYPGLAALAADDKAGPIGDPGRYDDRGRHGDRGRYDDRGWDDGYSEQGRPYGRDPYQSGPDKVSPAQLFGQITIYTLIEDRTREFDHLTERVVAQVREQEPGTLAYIVHAVPTAPMQRILYEVYRDQDAHNDHLRQPYIARFEAERRPFVLATNVIELGLQQVKVSAFPSFSTISDILSESGIDLTGVTRSSRPPGPAAGVPGGRPPGPAAGVPGGRPPGPARRPADDPGYQRHYKGWDEIRGEDERYR